MLLSAKYKQRMVALVVDKAHCIKTCLLLLIVKILNICICRGDEFRKTFSLIRNLWSLIPEGIHVMALTAIVTKQTFEAVCERLRLINSIITVVSCNRRNIKLIVQPKQQLDDFCTELARSIETKRKEYPKMIIFCRKYGHCTSLYHTLMEKLGRMLLTSLAISMAPWWSTDT